MRLRGAILALIIFCLVLGLGAFVFTRAFTHFRSGGESNGSPANKPTLGPELSERILSADPEFKQDIDTLNQAYLDNRKALNTMIGANRGEEETMAQAEEVIASHNRRVRRVVDYILKVRRDLSPENRHWIMMLMGKTFYGPGASVIPGGGPGGGPGGPGGGGPMQGQGRFRTDRGEPMPNQGGAQFDQRGNWDRMRSGPGGFDTMSAPPPPPDMENDLNPPPPPQMGFDNQPAPPPGQPRQPDQPGQPGNMGPMGPMGGPMGPAGPDREQGGFGMQKRFRQGPFAAHFGMSEERARELFSADPNFIPESFELTRSYRQEAWKLTKLIDNTDIQDNEIQGLVDPVLDAGAQLERRTIRHIIKIRPYLSEEHLKWLTRTPDEWDRDRGPNGQERRGGGGMGMDRMDPSWRSNGGRGQGSGEGMRWGRQGPPPPDQPGLVDPAQGPPPVENPVP